MAVGLGSDFSCVDDVDWNLTIVDDRLALAQSCARRLGTERGMLLDDIDYGEDLREVIGKPANRLEIVQKVELELLKDERVEDVTAEVTVKTSVTEGVSADEIGDVSIDIEIFPSADEPFSLTLDVSASEVTVEAIEGTPYKS